MSEELIKRIERLEKIVIQQQHCLDAVCGTLDDATKGRGVNMPLKTGWERKLKNDEGLPRKQLCRNAFQKSLHYFLEIFEDR